MTRFAHAVREELWVRGRRVESRLSHGEAVSSSVGILATDARDDALVARAEHELTRLRDVMPRDLIVRLVAEASTESTSAVMIVRDGALSVVTTPDHVANDVALLRSAGFQPAGPPASSRRPLRWLHGTAAVLLHESHGHPLEHNLAPLALPAWLQVDVPVHPRRASFRDIPLPRMQHVHVTQHDAPFDAPFDANDCIDIHLVEGGSYDPLTDTIVVRVSSSTIGPFELREQRTNLRFLGAAGEPQRYPGVICSREGQELYVASSAPIVITA